MTVNHIKHLFVALFLLISAGTATAANWQVNTNLNAAGGKDTLKLVVAGNSFAFTSFQVDFTLPDGLLPDGAPVLGELADGHTLTWKLREDGSYRCIVHSASNQEMKTPEGAVLLVPVNLAADFVKGEFTAKNGILSNKKSEAQPVADLTASLTSHKEKKNLVVNVSGLEQVVKPETPAVLTYTTVPDGKTLQVAYFTDESCNIAATDADRKQEGTLYVKLSYAGDEDYNAFERVYMMSLTNKKAIDVASITAPTAAPIKEGQLLSASLLTGGSVTDDTYTVAGTFAWTDGNVVVPAGEQSYSVTFYPDNSAYYNTAELSVPVEVTATHTITAVATTGGVANILGKTEDDKYVSGQMISLTAIPLPNYRFEGWSVTDPDENPGTADTLVVTVNKAKTYTALFAPIMHAVSIVREGNGTLSVTADKGTEVTDGASLQQGTALRILATPDNNARLKSLTVNGDSLKGDKVTLTEPLSIKAVFEVKPVDMKLVTIQKAENGSVLLYKEDGSQIASGSTVPVNSKIRVISLPDAGYQLDGSVSLSGTNAGSDNLYTVTGDVTASAAFTEKKYKVTAAAVSSNPNETEAAGTITLDKDGEQAYGTEVRITKIEGQMGARLLTILANGKEISRNEVLTVTGDLTVTAIFDHRVNIKKEYILWPYQEYYYNGVSRNFVPFASQTYAGFSFDVKYRDSKGTETDKVIDADNYTVLLHRDEDGLYNEFNEEYEEGLVIKKSKIAVTEAPENDLGSPKTRPGGDEVKITKETYKVNVTKYLIRPNSEKAKKNYEETVYYYSTRTPVLLDFGSILRSAEEPKGAVRVTNGGLPYEVDNGKVSIPEGVTVTLEAVPAAGYTFTMWSDGNSENPREYEVTAGTQGVTPEFTGKPDAPDYVLAASSSVYNGTAQTVSVTGEGSENCQITFFFDESCQQPAVLKNAGKYYVRIYRPEDKDYKAKTQTLEYTIEQASTKVGASPTASDILTGQKLSESRLLGGHAGVVAGTFAWSDPEAVMTATGEQEVTFTPTDPNYKPVTCKVKVTVIPVVASSTTDPEIPVTPVDPVDPDQPVTPIDPENPTGIESIQESMSLYAANRSILANLPKQVALTVIDVAGIVVYQETVTGEVMIPVSHAGVYFVRCEAAGESFVRKVVVR